MIGLTPRQSDCAQFMRRYQALHGRMPTYEHIRVGLQLGSKNGVHRLVHGLAERGVIALPEKNGRAMHRGAYFLDDLPPKCPHCANVIGSLECREAARIDGMVQRIVREGEIVPQRARGH